MTTIVVVKKNGKACIAADTLTSWGSTLQSSEYIADKSKIIQVGDTFIGIPGSTTHQFVLSSYFAQHKVKPSFKNRLEIFETWRHLHEVMKDRYHLKADNEKDAPYETTHMNVLLANPHGIFGVYALRSVDEFSKFWAFGSGCDYALGALYCCYDQLESVEEIATRAIEAAATFDDGTALPLTLRTVDLIEEEKAVVLPTKRLSTNKTKT
ncbi:MAG: hypothetical protein U0Y68_06005 [Blastocatellia bacterium]